ncbi:MAG: TRAP transporter small permease [Rhodocyclaceae bacterium]
MLSSILRLIERINLIAATVLLFGLIGVVMIQVVARPLPIPSPPWTEEVARFLMVYVVAFGCSAATWHRELVNVDILINVLPDRARAVLRILIDLVMLVCASLLFVNAIEYVELMAIREATTVPIPMSWVTTCVLVIMVNIALFTLANLAADFIHLFRGTTPDPRQEGVA